jgi:hypothetical protein
VHLGNLATAEQMLTQLSAKAGARNAPTASAGAHADHGAAPTPAAAAAAAVAAETAKSPRVMELELSALIALKKGDRDRAIAQLREAVAVEESMRPPNGAADPVKPSHELLGEVLLETGKASEAAAMFDACLLRMPNRARSLIGAAKAHAAAGHKELADARYKTLMSFWKGGTIARPTTEAR